MKLVCIADTHNRHDNLIIPDGDVLIHAGDITEGGTNREVQDFLDWFGAQPHDHKIFIAGNHDYYFEDLDLTAFNDNLPKDIHYLHNSAISINDIKFYGTPQVPSMASWAFNQPFYWDDIPKDTEILISHIPPYGILDLHDRNHQLGDDLLRKRIKELKCLDYHIFGHVHDSYGLTRVGQTVYINASSQDHQERYFNPPIVVEFVK